MKELNNFFKAGLLFAALCLIIILGFNSYLRWKEFNLSKNTVMPGRFVLMPKLGLTFLDTATGDIYNLNDKAGLVVKSLTKNHGKKYSSKLAKAAEFPRRPSLDEIYRETVGSGKRKKVPRLVPVDKLQPPPGESHKTGRWVPVDGPPPPPGKSSKTGRWVPVEGPPPGLGKKGK